MVEEQGRASSSAVLWAEESVGEHFVACRLQCLFPFQFSFFLDFGMCSHFFFLVHFS